MNFLGGILRGAVITILGTITVYVIYFVVMAPKLPKNVAGVKAFVSDMVNVEKTISKMQNKSAEFLERKEAKLALEGDNFTPEQYKKAVAEQELLVEAVPDQTEPPGTYRQLERMQVQLDRIENQNRQLSLRLHRLEKLEKITTD